MRQRSDRLPIILALRDQIGLSRLADLEAEGVRHRDVPARLVARLTEPDTLTPRQREVMVLLASGYTRPEIAQELGISPNTVSDHTKRAYARLGAHNRVEAINAFIEWEA